MPSRTVSAPYPVGETDRPLRSGTSCTPPCRSAAPASRPRQQGAPGQQQPRHYRPHRKLNTAVSPCVNLNLSARRCRLYQIRKAAYFKIQKYVIKKICKTKIYIYGISARRNENSRSRGKSRCRGPGLPSSGPELYSSSFPGFSCFGALLHPGHPVLTAGSSKNHRKATRKAKRKEDKEPGMDGWMDERMTKDKTMQG